MARFLSFRHKSMGVIPSAATDLHFFFSANPPPFSRFILSGVFLNHAMALPHLPEANRFGFVAPFPFLQRTLQARSIWAIGRARNI